MGTRKLRAVLSIGLAISIGVSTAAADQSRRWNLPARGSIRCSRADYDLWSRQTERQIDISGVPLVQPEGAPQELEADVIRNALVVEAYSHLYIDDQNRSRSKPTVLYWLGLATQGASIVGETLQSLYRDVRVPSAEEDPATVRIVESRPPVLDVPRSLRQVGAPMMAHSVLGGQLAIFRDMYWQQLAASYCGAASVPPLLEQEEIENPENRGPEYYDLLIDGWNQIASGAAASPRDLRKIRAGNVELMWVEQKLIIDPVMYRGLEGHLGGLIFGVDAVAPMIGAGLPSFDEFVDENPQYGSNIADFRPRFEWMNQVVAPYAFDQIENHTAAYEKRVMNRVDEFEPIVRGASSARHPMGATGYWEVQ